MSSMIQDLNLTLFKKKFALSKRKFESSVLFEEYLRSLGFVEPTGIDFIGPHALHNTHHSALSIGQSLTESGAVLFIDLDGVGINENFVKAVESYQASEMTYLSVSITNEKVVKTENPLIEFNLVNKSIKKLAEEEFETVLSNSPSSAVNLMNWDQAKQLVQEGKLVRRLMHGPISFVGFCAGKTLEADKFWVAGNKRAAMRNGGFLDVKPYYTFCDGKSVDMAWRPTTSDEIATDWILFDQNIFLTSLVEESKGTYVAGYELLNGQIENGANKFIAVYDWLAETEPTHVCLLSPKFESTTVILSLLTDMKIKLHGSIPFTETRISAIEGKPFNSDAINFDVHKLSIRPGDESWDLMDTLLTIQSWSDRLPKTKFILDLKGLAESTELDHLDPQEKDELAIGFSNALNREIRNNGLLEREGFDFLIIDLDGELDPV